MELKDTINLMESEDFKERFKAEYYQLAIRIDGLSKMLAEYKNGKLTFTPKCSYECLSRQLKAMNEYRDCLMERACIEDIIL